MKKNLKKFSLVMAMVMGCSLLSGCGNSAKKTQEKMVDKYASYCELTQYTNLDYTKVETEITDEVMDAEINYLLSNFATVETVTTGTTKNGDTVNIDFTGTVDGVAFDGGSTDGQGYDLTLGSGYMIPGFEEQIVGHDVGETFDIEVTFPEDYGNTELAGVDAVFEITINNIQVTVLPAYDDAFVAANTDYATVAELEEAIVQSIKDSDDSTNKTAIIETILNSNTYVVINEYPEKELQELIDKSVESVTAEAATYGMDFATYVSARYGTSEENFKAYISQVAEDFIREKIVICAIAKAENITVTEDEIKDYKKIMMEQLGYTEDQLEEEYSEEDIIFYTISDKVYEFLLENNPGTVATSTDAAE